MAEENKYMDDSFKKMSQEFKASYDKSFWNEAAAKLDDASLDNAFKLAAETVVPLDEIKFDSADVSDAFMDDAFKDVSSQMAVTYDPAHWKDLEASRATMEIDDAFFAASKKVKANYNPIFWGDANVALEKEGLHYEYKAAYWDEAKSLLDKADRSTFFMKWAGVAAILLLISFVGANSLNISQVRISEIKTTKSYRGVDNVERNFNSVSPINEQEIANNNVVSLIDLSDKIEDVINIEQDAVQLNQNVRVTEDQITLSNQDSEDDLINNQQELEIENSNFVDEKENDSEQIEYVDDKDAIGNALLITSLEEEVKEEKNFQEEIFDYALTPIESDIALIQTAIPFPEINRIESSKIEPIKLRPTHSISLIASAGLGQNYGLSDGLSDGLLLRRYSGGISYTMNGTGKLRNFEFGGSFGVNHTAIEDLGVEYRSSTFTDLGKVIGSWSKVQFTDIFYANANFLTHYKLSDKNKLKLGFGIERLVGIKSNTAYFIPEEDGIRTVNNNWGVEEGFNNNDFRVSLGYEYKISNQLSLQLDGNFGLLDRTDDLFFENANFGQSIFDRETNVMIGLKYTIFRKI